MKIEPQVGMRVEFPNEWMSYTIVSVGTGVYVQRLDNGHEVGCNNIIFYNDLSDRGGVVKFPKAHYIKLFKEAYGR